MTQPITSSKNSLSICIIYHSNYGHTRRVAHAIAQGVGHSDSIAENKDSHTNLTKPIEPICLDISKMNEASGNYDKADMLVFGCAVYMGSVTAEFKAFMGGRHNDGLTENGTANGRQASPILADCRAINWRYYNKSVCLLCSMA